MNGDGTSGALLSPQSHFGNGPKKNWRKMNWMSLTSGRKR
jgi:hypothetical protein